MTTKTIAVCKFVGTISLGLLTGISATHTTLTLPSLLTLPTALTARSTLTHLTASTKTVTTYLRHITTFALFSAYLLAPRRFRHPYLLYTSILTFASGRGVDYAITLKEGKKDQRRLSVDLEAGEEVNGEKVRAEVEQLRIVEAARAGVAGLAFLMGVIGIWGDGA